MSEDMTYDPVYPPSMEVRRNICAQDERFAAQGVMNGQRLRDSRVTARPEGQKLALRESEEATE